MTEQHGLTNGPEKRLTLEAQQAIRKFMLRYVTLPGIFVPIVAFAFGFFWNDIMKESARQNALKVAQQEIKEEIDRNMNVFLTTISGLSKRIDDSARQADLDFRTSFAKLNDHVSEIRSKASMVVADAERAKNEADSAKIEVLSLRERTKKAIEDYERLRTEWESSAAAKQSGEQIEKIAAVLMQDERVLKPVYQRLSALDEKFRINVSFLKFEIPPGDNPEFAIRARAALPFPPKNILADVVAGYDFAIEVFVEDKRDDYATVVVKGYRDKKKPRIGYVRVVATGF
ncbi:MAG: hypothetical protein V2B18_01815 [Pseudomonadota bacterium]